MEITYHMDRKTTPPKSHKKVNHGDTVNASEL